MLDNPAETGDHPSPKQDGMQAMAHTQGAIAHDFLHFCTHYGLRVPISTVEISTTFRFHKTQTNRDIDPIVFLKVLCVYVD